MINNDSKKNPAIIYEQGTLFGSPVSLKKPPSTRYQGSKLKLLDWIWSNLEKLEFETFLEPFGGTGCVSYMLKSQKKQVTYNDYLKFNQIIGTALIENSQFRLLDNEVDFVLKKNSDISYDNFVERKFKDVFYTDEENRWLDIIIQNIPILKNKYKRALAYYALFQSCIIKRPYNLFHRKNLYMRTSNVKRNFGNKVTWDTPFEVHFRNFVREANNSVFDTGMPCQAICSDALEIDGSFDLVYIDTPYLNSKGIGVDYFDFYHFLEGITNYKKWLEKINERKKHFPLKGIKSPWSDPSQCHKAFKRLFKNTKTVYLSFHIEVMVFLLNMKFFL